MNKKTYNVAGKILILASLVFTANCGGAADPVSDYDSPVELHAFGQWGESEPLRFRAIKTAEQDTVMIGLDTVQATRGNHFVLVTLQVVPAQKGKGYVDYPSQVRLLDADGRGYQVDPMRFQGFNNSNTSLILIKSGKFVQYVLPFLVPRDFNAIALRCVGEANARPVHLALRREE